MARTGGIGQQIFAVYTGIILAVILTGGVAFGVYATGAVRTQVASDLSLWMNLNRANLDRIFDSVDRATNLLYNDEKFFDVLNSTPPGLRERLTARKALADRAAKSLYIPLAGLLSDYTVSVFVEEHFAVAAELMAGDLDGNGLHTDAVVRTRPWYPAVEAAQGRTVWFTEPSVPGRFFAARTVKNLVPGADGAYRANGTAGLLLVSFSRAQLAEQFGPALLTPGMGVSVVDDRGHTLFSSGGEGATALSLSTPLAPGWTLRAGIPEGDVSGRALPVALGTGLLCLLVLVLAEIILRVISQRISAPITALAHTMEGMTDVPSLTVKLEGTPTAEVGVLYRSFQDMVARVRVLMDEVYRLGMQQKYSEVKALQAEINPHFLYNVLDTINWMALKAGVDPIDELISRLSAILRYAISNQDELVPFAVEADHVRRYVEIQNLCYGTEFPVEYAFEPDALDALVPKLILQPLVENALVHGLRRNPHPGLLRVTARVDAGTLVVNVADNGVGGDPERLTQAASAESPDPANRHGIRNVGRRIQLLYGRSFGLTYHRHEGPGITAELRLPREVPTPKEPL